MLNPPSIHEVSRQILCLLFLLPPLLLTFYPFHIFVLYQSFHTPFSCVVRVVHHSFTDFTLSLMFPNPGSFHSQLRDLHCLSKAGARSHSPPRQVVGKHKPAHSTCFPSSWPHYCGFLVLIFGTWSQSGHQQIQDGGYMATIGFCGVSNRILIFPPIF